MTLKDKKNVLFKFKKIIARLYTETEIEPNREINL